MEKTYDCSFVSRDLRGNRRPGLGAMMSQRLSIDLKNLTRGWKGRVEGRTAVFPDDKGMMLLQVESLIVLEAKF